MMDVREKSILEELPQIPFVLDQVGEAIKWARETYDEGKLNKVLRVTVEVAKWVTSISNPNFYKTHLVIASLLSEMDDPIHDPRFKPFDTASKAVENALVALKIPENNIEDIGCFNSIIRLILSLAKTNEEYLALALYKVLDDIKEITGAAKEAEVTTPVTPQDYITILGYALLLANTRIAKLSPLYYNKEILNNIAIELNSLRF